MVLVSAHDSENPVVQRVAVVVGLFSGSVLQQHNGCQAYEGKRVSQWAEIYASANFTLASHLASKHAIEHVHRFCSPGRLARDRED